MTRTLDRRVVAAVVADFLRACQKRIPCHLGGGAALSGAYLEHRTTGDVDLFCHDAVNMRALVRLLPEAAAEAGLSATVLRDAGHLVRARVGTPAGALVEVDVVYEPVEDLESPPPPIEGIVIESLLDLRASKLTCILSRSEPRDLVDLYFLEQAGFPPDRDLDIAVRKDAGIDPGIIGWLLSQFPTSPLPNMLKPLGIEELRRFRDELAERFRGGVVD